MNDSNGPGSSLDSLHSNNRSKSNLSKKRSRAHRKVRASVSSLVQFRAKRQGSARQPFQVISSGLRDDRAPLSDGSTADAECARDVDRLLEMGNDIRFVHGDMLTIVPSVTQPSLAPTKLTLVNMKDWKDCETLVERLNWALERSGASKADLARACHISTAAVSKWFTGDTANFKNKNLFATAKALAVNPEWLATGEGSPHSGIASIYTDIKGPDLQIARALTELDDKKLRGTIRELITAKAEMAKTAEAKRTAKEKAALEKRA